MKDRRNLEQQLADKLGNRSIAPSEQAWDRIVRNREQGKDKKKKTAYLYYAASIVVVMLFGGYFFMLDRDDVSIETQVVSSDDQKEEVDVNTPDVVPETAVQPKQIEIAASYEVEKNTNLSGVHKDEVRTISEPYKEVEPREILPAVSVAFLHDKKNLSKEQLSEQEADYLLRNAVKEVAADKLLSKPTSDTALLKEVESEMDEYYREKAMSIFSLKHKKIRFAVKE